MSTALAYMLLVQGALSPITPTLSHKKQVSRVPAPSDWRGLRAAAPEHHRSVLGRRVQHRLFDSDPRHGIRRRCWRRRRPTSTGNAPQIERDVQRIDTRIEDLEKQRQRIVSAISHGVMTEKGTRLHRNAPASSRTGWIREGEGGQPSRVSLEVRSQRAVLEGVRLTDSSSSSMTGRLTSTAR